MQRTLNKILEEYLNETGNDFSNNQLGSFIRKNSIDAIYNKAKIDSDKYKIQGSCGQGRWVTIPWIGIMDRDITETVQKGYDIVYLFCADMSGVYLSLNQGWTFFTETYPANQREKYIELIASEWKKRLSSSLDDFSLDSIDLKSNSKSTKLPKGYELGHICGKYYSKGNIPSDAQLIDDIRNLMGVYRELKGKMIEQSTDKTNFSILSDIDMGLAEVYPAKVNSEMNELTSGNLTELQLMVEAPPSELTYNTSAPNFTPKETNYIAKARNDKEVGHSGERFVLNYERTRLRDAGNPDLADKVEHTSVIKGDGAGYDILSFNTDGSKRFIEVKTTKSSKNTPFYLSNNELEFSIINSDNYYLYRVFNLDGKKTEAKLFVLKGDINSNVEIEPTQYISTGIFKP